jgi:tight adherence protein C
MAALALLVCAVEPLPAQLSGPRGRRRAAARESAIFLLVEPVLRLLGAHAQALVPRSWQCRLDEELVLAGDWLGLRAPELVVLQLVMVLGALALSLWSWGQGAGLISGSVWLVAGAALVPCRLRSVRAERVRSIERALPEAIDLLCLCVGAGLDFVRALALVVDELGARRPHLRGELERVLHELSLGRLRRDALSQVADRVPSKAVRELMASLVQADEKGTPIVEVLRVQGRALRGRRSVLAEELAARAGVKLMFPLILMTVSVGLLLLGPLLIDLQRGGLL